MATLKTGRQRVSTTVDGRIGIVNPGQHRRVKSRGNTHPKTAPIASARQARQRLRRPPLRSGPPGDPHGPLRLSTPVRLAFTPGPPPVMAAPALRGAGGGVTAGARPGPRWLLAIPDAIRQLDALDRELLTRRDIERLFGVSKVRAAQLMATFGAGRTGHILTLPRAALLRQLRRHRTRAAFRGEETRRDRVVTAIRQARLTGIRVAVPREARDARLSGLPAGVSVEPGRIEVRFSGAAGRRRAALRARPGADARLRAVRGARRRGGRGGRRRGCSPGRR